MVSRSSLLVTTTSKDNMEGIVRMGRTSNGERIEFAKTVFSMIKEARRSDI